MQVRAFERYNSLKLIEKKYQEDSTLMSDLWPLTSV